MFGEIGILAYDPLEDKVQCHICGKWYLRLGKHVQGTHHWTTAEYREEFGLNRTQALVSEGERQRLRKWNLDHNNSQYLISQTASREELLQHLQEIRPPKIERRLQGKLSTRARMREYCHLNTVECRAKCLKMARELWYGSERQRALSRINQGAAVVTRHERNVENRKWACSCGLVFPIREALRSHQRNGCSYKQ